MDTSEFRKPRPDFPIVTESALYRERVKGFKVPKGRRGKKPRGKRIPTYQPSIPLRRGRPPNRYQQAKTQEITENAKDRRERLQLEKEIAQEQIRYRVAKTDREAAIRLEELAQRARTEELTDRLLRDQQGLFQDLLERQRADTHSQLEMGERRQGELAQQYQDFIRQVTTARVLPEKEIPLHFFNPQEDPFEEQADLSQAMGDALSQRRGSVRLSPVVSEEQDPREDPAEHSAFASRTTSTAREALREREAREQLQEIKPLPLTEEQLPMFGETTPQRLARLSGVSRDKPTHTRFEEEQEVEIGKSPTPPKLTPKQILEKARATLADDPMALEEASPRPPREETTPTTEPEGGWRPTPTPPPPRRSQGHRQEKPVRVEIEEEETPKQIRGLLGQPPGAERDRTLYNLGKQYTEQRKAVQITQNWEELSKTFQEGRPSNKAQFGELYLEVKEPLKGGRKGTKEATSGFYKVRQMPAKEGTGRSAGDDRDKKILVQHVLGSGEPSDDIGSFNPYKQVAKIGNKNPFQKAFEEGNVVFYQVQPQAKKKGVPKAEVPSPTPEPEPAEEVVSDEL